MNSGRSSLREGDAEWQLSCLLRADAGTLAKGHFVAWFPEQVGITAPAVRQYNASGAELVAR